MKCNHHLYEEGVTTLVSTAAAFSVASFPGKPSFASASERNAFQAVNLIILLDAALAIAAAIEDNVLEALEALPREAQEAIQAKLSKIAEKTTQPLPQDSNEQR